MLLFFSLCCVQQLFVRSNRDARKYPISLNSPVSTQLLKSLEMSRELGNVATMGNIVTNVRQHYKVRTLCCSMSFGSICYHRHLDFYNLQVP